MTDREIIQRFHEQAPAGKAATTYIDWFNHRRLHSACDHCPPAEYEAIYYDQHNASAAPAGAQ